MEKDIEEMKISPVEPGYKPTDKLPKQNTIDKNSKETVKKDDVKGKTRLIDILV